MNEHDQRLSHMFSIRVSPKLLNLLEAAAFAEDLDVSEFARCGLLEAAERSMQLPASESQLRRLYQLKGLTGQQIDDECRNQYNRLPCELPRMRIDVFYNTLNAMQQDQTSASSAEEDV